MKPIVLITRDRIMWRRTAESVSVRSSRVQCRTMPIWLSVNDTNTPDDVQLDQRRDLGAERDNERDRGEREKQDAVGERQPVAAGVQLARQVTVLRQNRSQHREAVERGVGGEHQDQRRHPGDQEQPDREVVEDRVGQLRDQRLLVVARRCTDELLAGCRRSWRRSPWPA